MWQKPGKKCLQKTWTAFRDRRNREIRETQGAKNEIFTWQSNLQKFAETKKWKQHYQAKVPGYNLSNERLKDYLLGRGLVLLCSELY